MYSDVLLSNPDVASFLMGSDRFERNMDEEKEDLENGENGFEETVGEKEGTGEEKSESAQAIPVQAIPQIGAIHLKNRVLRPKNCPGGNDTSENGLVEEEFSMKGKVRDLVEDKVVETKAVEEVNKTMESDAISAASEKVSLKEEVGYLVEVEDMVLVEETKSVETHLLD